LATLPYRIYINPSSSDETNHGLVNPYIDDLVGSLCRSCQIVNQGKPSNKGIFDFIKYLRKTDYYYFNWIEKLPAHRFGLIQTFLFLIFLPLLKVMGKRIIWTMHNKLSHTKDSLFMKKIVFKNMLKYSDIILTHSSEGITYGKQINPGCFSKIHHFHHPVKDRRNPGENAKKQDVLIWGSLAPYKGVDKFLNYLYEQGIEGKYRIYIVGKCISSAYFQELEKYTNENIRIENKFISDIDLQTLVLQSRVILFIYSSPSVLGSGVLMDSLGFGGNIVGPDTGAFADLAKANLIQTFSDFDELTRILDDQLTKKPDYALASGTERFLKENSWDKFAEKLIQIIESEC
jgi:beta-1,4-mannosyltransferase